MELDLGEKPVLKAKIGGAVHEIAFPNIKQIVSFQESMKSSDGKELSLFLDLLEMLGLSKDISAEMTTNQLTKLSEVLMGASKKN